MEGDGYKLGKWGEHVNYECEKCPYSTLDERDIKEHIYASHVRPTLKDPTVLIYGADGEPVYAKPSEE